MQQYREDVNKYRRPFWMPALNYYFLAATTAAAFFVFVWGILHDGIDDYQWIMAAAAAVIILSGAVFLREVVLRGARDRFLSAKRLDKSLRNISSHPDPAQDSTKLTLERNNAILREIKQKSDAAKVLGKFSEGHKEVVDICDEYLAATARELPKVGAGSPRIAALRKGNKLAGRSHHFHMLQWVEIEARSLMQDANARDKISEKLDIAQKALGIVERGLAFYPDEIRLLESQALLQDFTASIKVSNWIDKAERAFFKGNHKRAIDLYKDALFDLERDSIKSMDRQLMAEKIHLEIKRIKGFPEKT
ncbi:MAG: hypothetical protein M3Q26_01555 [Acidobacteriota bacterium]|nr:hypothetical protein [Acidobacteriota bacterium]